MHGDANANYADINRLSLFAMLRQDFILRMSFSCFCFLIMDLKRFNRDPPRLYIPCDVSLGDESLFANRNDSEEKRLADRPKALTYPYHSDLPMGPSLIQPTIYLSSIFHYGTVSFIMTHRWPKRCRDLVTPAFNRTLMMTCCLGS